MRKPQDKTTTRKFGHKAEQDKTRQEGIKTRQPQDYHKTRQDKTRQDKTREGKTRRDETRQDKT